MIYLGLDPGTSGNMAMAALLPDNCDRPLRVQLAACSEEKEAKDRAADAYNHVAAAFNRMLLPLGWFTTLALEWQRPLPGDRRPKNICDLSAFAGIALATIQSRCRVEAVYTPLPEEWKGSVSKWVKHNRIVAAVGLKAVQEALAYAYIPIPSNLGSFTREFTGKAGNALDAIGLALWVRERSQLLERARKATLSR
jgi:hypothetical protein